MLPKRAFLVIFIVLIIITVAEVIYYFFYQTPTKVSTKSLKPTQAIQQLSNDKNQALNEEKLTSLRFLKKGIVQSSILINSYKGIVTDIQIKEGKFKGMTYKAVLNIKGVQKDSNSFFYTEEDFKKMKVLRMIKGKEQPINLNELKVNDSIFIEETVDLLKDVSDNLISIKFVKE